MIKQIKEEPCYRCGYEPELKACGSYDYSRIEYRYRCSNKECGIFTKSKSTKDSALLEWNYEMEQCKQRKQQ